VCYALLSSPKRRGVKRKNPRSTMYAAYLAFPLRLPSIAGRGRRELLTHPVWLLARRTPNPKIAMGCASSTPVVIADPAKPEELKPIAAEEAPVLRSAPPTANVIVPPAEVVATEEEKPVAKPSTDVVAAAPAPVAAGVLADARSAGLDTSKAVPAWLANLDLPAPTAAALRAAAEPVAEVVPEVVAPALAPAVAPAPEVAPAPAISAEALASYKEAFSVFDKDGSGTVSTSELGEMMSALGQNLSAEELDAIVVEVDANRSGEIDFDEFCACMQKAKEGGATTPKLAVIVEESSLLSGLRSFLGRLLFGAPMEESAAAEAAAAAAAKAAADRQLAANLAANLDAERVYKTQEAAATEAAAAEAAAAAVKAAAEAAAAAEIMATELMAAAQKAAAAETRKNRYKLVRCKCCTFSHFALCDACPRCHDAAPRG